MLDADVINAYSAHGGYIFITKGAIMAMENEAQLAGVLAHEIIHISRKHIVKELNIKGGKGSAVDALTSIVGGAFDTSQSVFVVAVDQALEILFERGHKREDEIEADTIGAVLMATSGYNPAELNGYFEKLKMKKGPAAKQLEKLYPPFDERIMRVKKALTSQGIDFKDGKKYKNRFIKNAGSVN